MITKGNRMTTKASTSIFNDYGAIRRKDEKEKDNFHYSKLEHNPF